MRHNLVEQRKRKGYTQKSMADKIGVARPTYNAYELGTVTPSLDISIKIKKVLEYNDDDIFLNKIVSKNDKNT